MNSAEAGAALVTGAASGIGLATATRLARSGRPVTLVDRDTAAVEAVAAALASDGHRVLARACDVTDFDLLEALVHQTQSEHGPFTAVAACAGIEVLGTVLELDPAQWRKALDVNATGVFNTAKAAMPGLLRTRGAFVAVASDAGTSGAQGYSAYAASKHAVVGLVRCLALDFGPRGVRSNAVAPAFVETPMARRIFEDSPEGEEDFYRQAVPLGRFATPEEVAAVIEHLLGDGASYTNGLVYAVDGGATAGYYRPA
jgi:meso-butanediol dehydrogenase / (S,S)-butanediol dehydrogenase / diacetyl reductase